MSEQGVIRDSGGGIKINLHDREAEGDNNIMRTADSYTVPTDTVIIFGHGNPYNVFDDRAGKDARRKELTPPQLAQIILDSGGKPTDTVILHSCSTGKGDQSFARQLSFYFKEVIAPTRELMPQGTNASESEYVDRIYGDNPDGSKNLNDPGRMKQFHSEDRIAYLMNPKLVDSPESERPSPQWDKNPMVAKSWQREPSEIPTTNRDIGDEEPFEKNAAKQASVIPLDYFSKMKEAYQSAVNPENKDNFEAKKTQAINDYPELKLAFLAREKMLEYMAENKADSAIAGVDGHIANSIESRKVYALAQYVTVMEAETHQEQMKMAAPGH